MTKAIELNVIYELDEDNNVKNREVKGYKLLNKETSNISLESKVYFYLHNEHSDVTSLVDEDNEVKNSYEYDVFGDLTKSEEEVNNEFKYYEQQWDNETHLLYLRARYYNPTVGRFTQEDIYRGDGLNLYAYVKNNPVIWVDPSGYKSHSNKNIDYGELDELGRPTGVKATIDADMIKTGTKANQSIKPPGFGGGGPNSPGHARGHLLGNQLGGSGDEARNLVTLYQNPVNTPVMRDIESEVRKAVENGEIVEYISTPIYNGSDLIPMGVTISAKGDGGLDIFTTILNRK